jgi:hypothetical protein
MDQSDLSQFKLITNPLLKKKHKSLPHHKTGELFLKGPIPENWLALAARLPGKAFQVGLAAWMLGGMKRTRSVKLSFKRLSNWGVKRNSVYRGLNALEKASLISVDRHRGRSPIVTILEVCDFRAWERETD